MPVSTSAAPTTVTEIHSRDEAAAVLGISPVAVSRLHARGRLTGTIFEPRDGKSPGQLRVLAQSLTGYVASGAKDFQPPKVATDGWFDDRNERWMVDRFVEVLSPLTEAQRLEDSAVAELANKQPLRDSFDVTLKVTLPMREVIDGPPVQPKLPNKPEPPYGSWGDLWLTHQLRRHSRAALEFLSTGPAVFGQSLIERFYGSPEVYQAVLTRTIRAVLQRNAVVWTESRSIVTDPALAPRVVRVSYLLPVAAFANEADLRQLADQFAF